MYTISKLVHALLSYTIWCNFSIIGVLRAQRQLWSALNLHIASISIDGPGHFKHFINSKGWLLFSGFTNALTKACLPFCRFSIELEAFPYKLVIWIAQRKTASVFSVGLLNRLHGASNTVDFYFERDWFRNTKYNTTMPSLLCEHASP